MGGALRGSGRMAADMNEVAFDKSKLDELRRFYKAAVKDKVETFHLDGNEYFVPYAKYLIEYLERKLTPERR